MVRTVEDKFEAEITTHTSTREEKSKLLEDAKKSKVVNMGLQELLEKKKAWYDEQLVCEQN